MSRTPIAAEAATATVAVGDFINFDDISDGNSQKKVSVTNLLAATTAAGAVGTTQRFYVSAQKDTITTVLADVTGLTGVALIAGAKYKFRAVLPGTSDGTSGISYGFKYTTATLTSIQSTGITYAASAITTTQSTTATDQALLVDKAAVVLCTIIEGTMVVNAAGTLALQVGTHTGTTTASVYLGGTMDFTRIA